MKAKVVEPKFDIHLLLQAKGVLLVESNPNVLHYTGDSLKEFNKLIGIYKPDLAISHGPYPDFKMKIPLIYHPVKAAVDFLRPSRIVSNSDSLSRTYYKRLGIITDIRMVERSKPRFETSKIVYILLLWNRFKSWMYWD